MMNDTKFVIIANFISMFD